MATVEDIINYARARLRDTGKLFQDRTVVDGVSTVFDLPVPNVDPKQLDVKVQTDVVSQLVQGSDYVVEDVAGQILLNTTPPAGATLIAQGVYFTWFTDRQIEELAPNVIGRYNADSNYSFANADPASPYFEVVAVAVVVEMLWSVWTETSFEINLRNPEGVDLDLGQRFTQLEQLIAHWTDLLVKIGSKLNIGIDRIEVSTLRRISRTTNRYIPLYVSQEIDDHRTPQRIYPPIDVPMQSELQQRYSTAETVTVEVAFAATDDDGAAVDVSQYAATIALLPYGTALRGAVYYPATWRTNSNVAEISVGPNGVAVVLPGRYNVHGHLDLPGGGDDILAGEVEFYDP